jgi:nucleotide-binding universal stress UspA family protein
MRETSIPPDEKRSVVVVGVDGSPGSLAALDAALVEARRRDAVLRIVTVWFTPSLATGFAARAMVVDELYAEARLGGETVMAAARAHLPAEPGVPVETLVVDGHPSTQLIAAAKYAELLVVGRRGHNLLSEILIGSTSRACIEHAPCPVLVVPRADKVRQPATAGSAATAAGR